MGDRDGVYGAPRLHQAAVKAGIRAIVGCHLTMAGGGELYVLISERAGYRNLCRLLTDSKLRAPKGEAVVEWSDLEGRSDGLICLTREAAWLERLQRLFPRRLYVELQRHLDPAEERMNRVLVAAAARHQVPLVATNDVRHATRRRAAAARRAHVPAREDDARRRRPPPARQRRAPPQAGARDGGALPRSAGRAAQHPPHRRAVRVHARRSRLPLPRLSAAAGRDGERPPARAERGGRAPALRLDHGEGAQPARARAAR